MSSVPQGYHTVTPYLLCKGAAAAIEFYKKAFGATELMRIPTPEGTLGHAEIRIGDSVIMLADEQAASGAYGPIHYGGSPISILLYVPDVDAMVRTAIDAGAELVHPVKDQPYGDRTGIVKDPAGHQWYIHTRMKNMTPAEMIEAMQT